MAPSCEQPETTLVTRAGLDSHPETLALVARYGRDDARQPVRVRRSVVHELAAAQRRQPGLGADPQHAVPVGVQRGDDLPGSEAFGRTTEAVALQMRQPVVRSDPEAAVGIGGQRSDPVARQAVAGIEGGEAAVLETGQPAAVGPDPEGRGAIFRQRPDLAVPELAR